MACHTGTRADCVFCLQDFDVRLRLAVLKLLMDTSPIILRHSQEEKLRSISALFITIAATSLLTACSVPIKSIDKTVKKSDVPAVGEIQTAELGAKLLSQQDVEIVRGRKVAQPTRGSMGLFPADFGDLYVRANDGEHYCGFIIFRDPLNNGKRQFICFTDQEFKEKGIAYEEVEEINQRPQNFQRVLEYSGKSGNSISVFYKEFNETKDGAFIRPAFTQEFKFDLADGSVIGVKGARLEVLQATNTGLTYKVISHFPR